MAALLAAAVLPGRAAEPKNAGVINDWLRRQVPETAPAFDLGVDLRGRFETKQNAGTVANRDFARNLDNDNDVWLARTRVHLGWKPTGWFQAFAQGRDSRAEFDQPPPNPERDTFDLHQAWVQVGDAAQFPLTLKAGRQEMLYGDERFLGMADWNNIGRVFDAAKLRFERPGGWVDAFAGRQVLPVDGEFNVANDYDWFSGVYAGSAKLLPWQDTEAFFLARNVGAGSPNAAGPGLGGPGPRDVYTPGVRVKSRPGRLGPWDYSAEVAGQFGSIAAAGRRLTHAALAADAQGGFTFTNAWAAPRVGLGYTHGSGDDDPADDRSGTFDLLFGTNHRLYGNMDIAGLRNLHTPSLSLALKPARALTLRIEALAFWMAEGNDFFYPESGRGRSGNGYGINPAFDPFVGAELDVLATWRPRPWADVQAGYGHFFAGDYVRQSVNSVPANGGVVDADWFYASVRLRF